jgi:hypothetical protein
MGILTWLLSHSSFIFAIVKYVTRENAAAESLRAMFVRDFLTVKTVLWTGPVCMDSYRLTVDLEILCDDRKPNVRIKLQPTEERTGDSK